MLSHEENLNCSQLAEKIEKLSNDKKLNYDHCKAFDNF